VAGSLRRRRGAIQLTEDAMVRPERALGGREAAMPELAPRPGLRDPTDATVARWMERAVFGFGFSGAPSASLGSFPASTPPLWARVRMQCQSDLRSGVQRAHPACPSRTQPTKGPVPKASAVLGSANIIGVMGSPGSD
jgi:hypothetical protein